MSVTIDGVKGYEYQYKISVLVSLLNNNPQTELYIEPDGGEDIHLVLYIDGIRNELEIQVKSETGLLSLKNLVSWLSHFKPRLSSQNLLNRIIHDENRIAIFLTQCRCSDETVKLKQDYTNLNQHSNVDINKVWFEKFKYELGNQKFGATKLMSDRSSFCSAQNLHFNVIEDLENVLKRIVICDEFSEQKIDELVLNTLNQNYQITHSISYGVYHQILDIVRRGRDERMNIQPLINNVLNKNRIGHPIIDKFYIKRIEDNILIKQLEDVGVLLLTGASQCGKSELAKSVAAYFFEKGYDYNIFSNVDEVQRFFSSAIQDTKIAILEDPWGHIVSHSNSLEISHKIKQLIRNIQQHHKLIITSKSEILLEFNFSKKIEDCKIGNFSWLDLTIKDNNLILKYWKSFSETKLLPQKVVDIVSKQLLIEDVHKLLQIGQLYYLANQEIELLVNKNYLELEHIARHNSKDIAISVKQKDDYFGEILSILSFCSTSVQPIRKIDLAYILAEDDETVSVIDKSFFTSSLSDDDDDDDDVAYPLYPINYSLSEDAEKALEFLDERHFIISYGDEEIVFSHPDYYEAGRFLFFSGDIRLSRFMKTIKRCLSSLSPDNCAIAAKQLAFLYDGVVLEKQKTSIIDIGFFGLNSIYPSVMDSSLVFLLRVIDSTDNKRADKIIQETVNARIDDSHIYWHLNIIPYISTCGDISKGLFKRIEDRYVEIAEVDLKSSKTPSAFFGWCYISNISHTDDYISHNYLENLLQYDEAFIRSKVAFYVLIKGNSNYESLLDTVFNDEHPNVVFNAIRASFISWHKYTFEFKSLVHEFLLTSISKKQVSIRTYNLLATFSIDYSGECIYNWKELGSLQKKELWNLWGELYPISVNLLPLNVFYNTARFSSSMSTAFEYIDVEIGIKVLETWYKRIDFQLHNGKMLDEFEMSIVDNLMQLTNSDFHLRQKLFKELVNYEDTNFLLSNLKSIIQHWDKLDLSETEMLKSLLRSDRTDVRWINAVFLTSYNQPEDVVFEITNEKELFTNETDYILSKFPKQLLEDCLHVYCGYPQPLYWLGLNNLNRNFWNKAMKTILLDESNVGFEICVKELLHNGVNGFQGEWNDGLSIWKNVCAKSETKSLLTDCLIYNTATCTCTIEDTTELWTILKNSYIDVGRENEFLSQICDNIEVLQQTTGGEEDLLLFFTDGYFLKRIIPNLEPDIMYIRLIDFLSEYELEEDKQLDLLNIFIQQNKGKTIRTFIVEKYISNRFRKGKICKKVKDAFELIPNNINEIGGNKLTDISNKYNYQLENWVSVYINHQQNG